MQRLQEEFGSQIQLLILVCSGRKRVHFEWMPEGQYSMRLSCPEECFGCYFFSRQRHTQLRNALQELLCFSLEQPSPQYGKCSGSLPSKLKSETRSHWMRAVQKMLRLVDAVVFAHSPVPKILHSMKKKQRISCCLFALSGAMDFLCEIGMYYFALSHWKQCRSCSLVDACSICTGQR